MKRTKPFTAPAKPDMTPLMDIVFIMLIFFIVTASFVREVGFEIARPANDPQTVTSNKHPLNIEISQENLLRINGRNIDVWAATALMKEQQSIQPDMPIVLSPHNNSNMRTLIRLYDAARSIAVTQRENSYKIIVRKAFLYKA